jgi:hypothetical protein
VGEGSAKRGCFASQGRIIKSSVNRSGYVPLGRDRQGSDTVDPKLQTRFPAPLGDLRATISGLVSPGVSVASLCPPVLLIRHDAAACKGRHCPALAEELNALMRDQRAFAHSGRCRGAARGTQGRVIGLALTFRGAANASYSPAQVLQWAP